jgi:hypothetical protein
MLCDIVALFLFLQTMFPITAMPFYGVYGSVIPAAVPCAGNKYKNP